MAFKEGIASDTLDGKTDEAIAEVQDDVIGAY